MTPGDRQTTTDGITVSIDGAAHLLGVASRSEMRTDLVVMPEQLHARNLKQRLAAANRPRSSLQLRGLTQVAADLVETTGDSPAALDRVDRIRTLEGLLEERPDEFHDFDPLFGSRLASHAADIEATRATVDAITGYDEERLATLIDLVETTPPVVQRDAQNYIDGAVAAERILAETSDVAVSGDAVLRLATRGVRTTGGRSLEDAYPDLERLHLAGVSSLDATRRAFLLAVAEETSVDVQLSLRVGTGPGIVRRLRDRPVTVWDDRTLPSVSLDAAVTEVVTSTREQEARVALALVTRLVDAGVSPSDVLVVARDVGRYERALRRAATHYAQPVSLWTQLAVTDTRPYELVAAVCELLDARGRAVAPETLFRPLFAEWVDPDGDGRTLPLRALDGARPTLETRDARSLGEWQDVVAEVALPESVEQWLQSLLTWTDTQPTEPTPTDVRRTIAPLLERYREVVLPAQRDRDDAALTQTTETARALVRLETLVEDVERKYAEWLERGQTDRTWAEVGSLFETIATIKPGRREHGNAAVVDVVDATDTWARTVPYVIAVGLVDGEWPLVPEGLLPVEVRDRILAGETPRVRSLSPREGWTTAREFDHFVDAVSTATECLVCTRYEQFPDGSAAHRSPFLDAIDPTPTRIGTEATTRLLSDERTLPEPLAPLVGRGDR